MAKSKKNDKPLEPSDEESAEDPKIAPWAIEIEFFNKPSFMASVQELKVDAEHISVVREDGAIIGFPYEAVRKILCMQTKKSKSDPS